MGKRVWKSNPNVRVVDRFSESENPYIEIIPYNRSVTPKYVRSIVGKLLKKYDNFVLYSSDVNFDGLSETNRGLIVGGVVIADNIVSSNYAIFKGKKAVKKVF